MYYVYVLLVNNGSFYTGYTEDLKKRLNEHQQGLVFTTKQKLPVRLVYYEACINQYDAIKREKHLKSGHGKEYIKYRIKNFLCEIRPRACSNSWSGALGLKERRYD